MDEKEFLEQMENLPKPDVNPEVSRRQLKLTLMSARKTAFWGFWFIAIPIVFLACIVVKEFLEIDFGFANAFIELMARIDRQSSTRWLTPLLFVLLPGVGALVNLLAIMHFAYNQAYKELVVTIRLKWLNIILALVSLGFIAMVILYGIAENAHHRAIEQIERGSESKLK